MSGAEPLSSLNFPRLFWPAALSLAAVLAAALLLAPLVLMFTDGSRNYNEGWNAYHQQETVQGEPLYHAPPRFVSTNYPPISFHLIGLASRIGGDVNQTGRWVSLLSLLTAAILCAAIVRRFTGSVPLAAYTALTAAIWLAVYKSDRIGMNDPQLLGTVFSLLGLYAYIRNPDKPAWLSISAAAFTVSVFTKHNLLAFPAAVGLHLLLERKWKSLAVWGGMVAAGSMLLLGLTLWIDGPYFAANILMPRALSIGLDHLTDYGIRFQLPIALVLVWWLFRKGRPLGHIILLALIMAHVEAFAFVGGYGVDKNIFFDCIFSLAMASALVFAEFAPLAAGWKRPGLALAALLLASSFGLVIQAPAALRDDRDVLISGMERADDFDSTVSLVQSRPGPALCEDLLICFDAGKPYAYDAYVMFSMVKAGRIEDDGLVALVEDASIQTVQLDKRNFNRGDVVRFTPNFVKALLHRYRIEKELHDWIVMVPKE